MVQKYYNSYTVSGTPDTTLATQCNPGDTTITVSSIPPTITSGTFQIKIDNELFNVTSITGVVWTVTHPVEGTSVATHLVGTGVYIILTAAAIENVVLDRDMRSNQLKIQKDFGYSGSTATITPSQITSSQNDYAPSGYSDASVYRLSSNASINITGIVAPTYSKRLILENIGSQNIVLKNASSSSSINNRFALASDVTLPASTHVELLYDLIQSKWVMIGGIGGGSGTVTESNISLSDVTTDNVTSTKHGFAPKSPADATKFLNGAATPDYAQVKDSDLSTSDVTTNDASTSKHGFLKKLSNNSLQFMDGTGNWSTPAGGGGSGGASVLLEQHTASSSASLVFTSISDTYDDYELYFDNILPATNDVHLIVQFSTDGGSTWINSGYTWSYRYSGTTGTVGDANSSSDSSARIFGNMANTAGSGFSGKLIMYGTKLAHKLRMVFLSSGDSAGNEYLVVGQATEPGTTARTAVRVLFSSGNISSGTVRLYGASKTISNSFKEAAPSSNVTTSGSMSWSSVCSLSLETGDWEVTANVVFSVGTINGSSLVALSDGSSTTYQVAVLYTPDTNGHVLTLRKKITLGSTTTVGLYIMNDVGTITAVKQESTAGYVGPYGSGPTPYTILHARPI